MSDFTVRFHTAFWSIRAVPILHSRELQLAKSRQYTSKTQCVLRHFWNLTCKWIFTMKWLFICASSRAVACLPVNPNEHRIFTSVSCPFKNYVKSWKSYRRGRLSTVDLHIKAACFVKKVNNVCVFKNSWYNLVSTRRSTVLCLPHFSKTSLVKSSLHVHLK